jgi:hypothetical protein
MESLLQKLAVENGLVLSFAVVGAVVLCSGALSRWLTVGRVQGSAIADSPTSPISAAWP